VRVPYREGVANRTVPRVMAVCPRGLVASVDRGRYGLGIEPRNRTVRSADALGKAEGNTARIANARYAQAPRGHRTHARTEASCAKPGRSRCWPWPVAKVRVVNRKVQP
jgi:hypothetical protein